MAASSSTENDTTTPNGTFISHLLRSFKEQSEVDKPFMPLVGGARLYVLLLYASVLVVASIEFFASQRLWYGSWDVYNTYVFVVTGVFVFLGMFMLFSAKRTTPDDYALPIPRWQLGLIGLVLLVGDGAALVIKNDALGGWAVLASVGLLSGFVLMVLAARVLDMHDSARLALFGAGLVVMIMVPVHEAFGVARSPSAEYPFTLLNLVLFTIGMTFALVAVQSLRTRDGFVGAWLMGAMAIFLIAFHEQLGIVASGNYSPYDRALALIGVTFSFLPLVMYVWRERVYLFLWTRLRSANQLLETGDYPGALKQTEAAIKQCARVGVEDRFSLPWSLKADVLYRMKDYDHARFHYETALGIDRNDSVSWSHMGNIYAFEGRQEAALKSFDEALKVDPRNPYAWNNKGAVYQSLAMYEDALVCFDKALSFYPEMFDAHINMAKLFSKLGHSSDALHHYQEALELRPESAVAKQGMQREFFRGMCIDQINGWEQLGLDTSYLKRLLDQDPQNFGKKSKEFLRNIVDDRAQLTVLPGIEHIDVQASMKAILKATEEPGTTIEKIEEVTNLKKKDLVLPLALLMETDHVHFKAVGRNELYVSKGKAPERPPEPMKPPIRVEAPQPPPPMPAPAPVEERKKDKEKEPRKSRKEQKKQKEQMEQKKQMEEKEHKRRDVVTVEPTASILVFTKRKK